MGECAGHGKGGDDDREFVCDLGGEGIKSICEIRQQMATSAYKCLNLDKEQLFLSPRRIIAVLWWI